MKAGADVLVQSWKGSIQAHGHVRKRDMIESVAIGKIYETLHGGYTHVYAQGYDSKGVPNNIKAYTIHYGYGGKGGEKTSKMGDHFVTEAEKNAKTQIDEAMQRAYNEFLTKKGL